MNRLRDVLQGPLARIFGFICFVTSACGCSITADMTVNHGGSFLPTLLLFILAMISGVVMLGPPRSS